jgi:hypothetical protein
MPDWGQHPNQCGDDQQYGNGADDNWNGCFGDPGAAWNEQRFV